MNKASTPRSSRALVELAQTRLSSLGRWNAPRRSRQANRAALALLVSVTCLLCVVILSSPASAQTLGTQNQEAEQRVLDLVVGENRLLSASGVKNYSEGTEGVIDVKLTTDTNQFVLVGRKPGTTTLMFIMNDGRQINHEINVLARSPAAVRAELDELLDHTLGVSVRRVGPRFVMEGQVHTAEQLARIEKISELFDGQVRSLVTVGAATGANQVNIRLDFFFIQYDNRRSFNVGIDYPGRIAPSVGTAIEYDLQNGAVTSATASIVDLPFPALDIASGTGWAKLLRHATVITTNGVGAKFRNGGEQNFVVANGLTSQIDSIDFGTEVSVLPNYDTHGNDIEVKVTADISELVPAISGTPLPGRTLSRLETIVKMRLGQALVLSGIKSSSERRTTRGLPFLSELPLVGMLFGSHGFQEEDLEGAIFIVPTTVDNVERSAEQRVRAALAEFADFDGDLETVAPYDDAPSGWSKDSVQPGTAARAPSNDTAAPKPPAAGTKPQADPGKTKP